MTCRASWWACAALMCVATGCSRPPAEGPPTTAADPWPSGYPSPPTRPVPGHPGVLETYLFPAGEPKSHSPIDSIRVAGCNPNGTRFVYVLSRELNTGLQRESIVLEGRRSPEYMAIEDVVWSPDGEHLAYVAKTPTEQHLVVRDGHPGPLFREVDSPAFSPDSRHLVYWATNDDYVWNAEGEGRDVRQSCFVVLDGCAGGSYDRIESVTLSPDGAHLAYVAERIRRDWRGRKRSSSWMVVRDGKSGPGYLSIDHGKFRLRRLVFSPDSRRLAYAAWKSGTAPIEFGWKDGLIVAVVDGVEGAEYGTIGELSFSRDSRHLMYLATRRPTEREFLIFPVLDGRELHQYDGATTLAFGPGEDAISAGVRLQPHADQPFVAIRGKRIAEYGYYDQLQVSPDGKHWAFVGGRGDRERTKQRVVVDGVPHEAYDEVTKVYFSPVGGRTAYSARLGDRWRVVVDGHPGPVYPSICLRPGQCYGPPAAAISFSLDGKRVAYWANTGDRRVAVVDGREQAGYPAKLGEEGLLPPAFSPDSRHVAYLVRRNGKWTVVVDGRPVFDFASRGDVFGTGFEADGSLVCRSRRPDGYYLIRYVPEGKE